MKEGRVGEGISREGLGAAKTSFVPPSPTKSVPRIDYERIFVVNDSGKLLGEYVLRDDCPLEFDDLVRARPSNGLRHLVTFYQGEYAFTPFRVENLWFIILTHGVPRIEERGSIGTLLAAMRVHLPLHLPPAHPNQEARLGEWRRELDARDADLVRREDRVTRLEAELRIAATKLKEMEAEVRSREARMTSLRDYAIQMQRAIHHSRSESEGSRGTQGKGSTSRTAPPPSP